MSSSPPAKRSKQGHNDAFVQVLQEISTGVKQATNYINTLKEHVKINKPISSHPGIFFLLPLVPVITHIYL
jgi:hypothetical protein